MMRETNVFGVYVAPLVSYMVVAGLLYLVLRPVLVAAGIQRWAWNVPLAEAAIYACILGALVRFL
jgi:fructose-specific phosphotransferase system IIC component